MVELIAVITILGVLVLIATPNFLDNTRGVKGQEITNNLKLVEYAASMYDVQNEIDITDGLIEIDPEVIRAAYEEGRLFNSDGYAYISRLEGFYDLTGTEITENMVSTTSGTYAMQDKIIYFISDESMNVAMEIVEDTEPPVVTVGSYDTTPTNGNVTVCLTTNEGYLNMDCYTFTENGSFDFIATDLAGNTTTETVTIDFIDKTPPVITLGAYTTDPTNQDVLVTATIDDGTFTSADNHTFTDNGSFTFTATDAVGNTSSEIVTITNIDKIPPTTPTFNVEVVGGTGTVTITYSADSATKQYKIDSGAWTDYNAPLVLTNNATVYAKGTDAAGNESPVGEADVVVDTTPPVVTFATNGSSTPMKTQSTAVNVVDDGSGVDAGSLQYVWSTSATTPGTGWASFSNGATLSQSTGSGTYYLHIKAADTIGNAGDYVSNSFNLDNTPPVITIGAYSTAPTNQNITVTASTNEGTLNATSHIFSANGSYTFTATDAAGNTGSETVTITNIDKTPPVITIGSYTTTPTNGNVVVTATTNEGTLNATSHTFTANGSYTFTATDAAGNTSSQMVTISNIDKTLPTVTFGTNGSAIAKKSHSTTVSVADNIGVSTRQYAWSTSTATPSAGWVSFTNGATITQSAGTGNYYLHIKATDAAGNIANVRSNAFNMDNTPPALPTISITTGFNHGKATITYPSDATTKQYQIGTGAWQTYTGPVTVYKTTAVNARGIDTAGNISGTRTSTVTVDSVVSIKGTGEMSAMTASGKYYVWGDNSRGHLGLGSVSADKLYPVLHPFFVSKIITDYTEITGNGFVVVNKNTVYGWGTDKVNVYKTGYQYTEVMSPTLITSLSNKNIIEAQAGRYFAIFKTGSNTYYGIGENASGAMGISTGADAPTAVYLTSLNSLGIKDLVINARVSVALTTSGLVYAWGDNYYQALAVGTTANEVYAPRKVVGLPTGMLEVANGGYGAMARNASYVYVWGDGWNGMLGLGNENVYTSAVELVALRNKGINDIDMCYGVGMASNTTTGVTYTWGSNSNGQLGLGHTVEKQTPQQVTALNGKKIAWMDMQESSAIIQLDTGAIYFWGRLTDGEMGNGAIVTAQTTPRLQY